MRVRVRRRLGESGDSGCDSADAAHRIVAAPRREGGPTTFLDALAALKCALLLRCPACRRGALFVGPISLTMHRQCPVCRLTFDRGDGYYTGALALNIVATEIIALAFWLPLALDRTTPIALAYAAGAAASVVAPILGFRHSRSLWISLDRFINPVR